METETQYNTPLFKDEEPEFELVIDWHTLKHEPLDMDKEHGIENWECLGSGNDGKEYSGIAYFVNDKLETIDEIQLF